MAANKTERPRRWFQAVGLKGRLSKLGLKVVGPAVVRHGEVEMELEQFIGKAKAAEA